MNLFKRLSTQADLVVAFGLMAIIVVMILPLPSIVLDFFLCLEIGLSILLLLISVYASRALDFSIFPSLLLITTLFRLSLNVATTRIILLHGSEKGAAAAGSIIQYFGEFIVGGNYAVGIITFTILVIINFVVITKGAGRVAEVAARFTLDAMPGKQMAIDADLNAGLINEDEARRRRSDIAKEADFYGAMDGSSKFVRGDAIAGILIVIINIIGGIFIGTFQKGMNFFEAASTFTLLTIGDGLVTQIPALIVSTAAGIIVTRTATNVNFSEELSKQLSMKPTAMLAAAGLMGILGMLPGLPFFPFAFFSISLGLLGYKILSSQRAKEMVRKEQAHQEHHKGNSEVLENFLSIDILELEVGYGLINLVDGDQNGGDLLERISNIRKQFVVDLGVIIPPLRIRDNLELKPGDYQILLKGIAVAQGSLMIGNLLAMDPGVVLDPIIGISTKEPAFGLDALWIASNQKEEAIYKGYTVVDASTVIATHLTEVIRQNISDLLGRQELQSLLDNLKQTAPKVVDELIPNVLPVGVVLRVLKNLLKENIPIRDLKSILESLADVGVTNKDPNFLTESVRSSMSRVITKRVLGSNEYLQLITLDRKVEEIFLNSLVQTDQGGYLSVDPDFARAFISDLSDKASKMIAEVNQAIVLCSPTIRIALKNLIDRFIPNVTVLSHNEILFNIKVQAYATIKV